MNENIKKWWMKMLLFLIAVIFSSIACLAQAHFGTSKIIINENTQQMEKSDMSVQDENEQTEQNDVLLQTIEAPLVDQKNEIVEKVDVPMPIIERGKNPANRLNEAMVYAKPQILIGKYIDISLNYQNMVIFENGIPLKAFLISSGIKGLYTPTGTFKIENKSPRAWSKDYSLWMPYWMAFLPSGYMGIHELPEWPGGYKEGADHLGTPASHGCVRLGVGSAKEVYDWAEIGTPVVIHK